MSRPASAAIRPVTVLDSANGRILCVADIRGRISALNDLAKETNAVAVIHTGDFGFFEATSLQRINDRTLRHLTMYSPLIPPTQRTQLLSPDTGAPQQLRDAVNISLISEFPLLLSGELKLNVPIFTVYGACEDVIVLEKFRSGHYRVNNLSVIDEATSRLLDVGGIKLRLLGLGGALVPHKMFDNGEGNATIAGGQGTMWTTALQIGELVDTAQKTFDPTETRVLITHASPGREGILAQLALVTKADLTLSAGLHFRYTTSYNEFSVQSDFQGFRTKLLAGKEQFDRVWETVKSQVEAVVDENQRIFLDKVLGVVERIPPVTTVNHPDEASWKNCWNWNLCDAAYGSLILDVKDGRVSSEMKSQGFNYAYRRSATNAAPTPHSATSALPNQSIPPTKGSTPVPFNKSSAPTPPPFKSATPAPPTKSSTPAPVAAPPAVAVTAPAGEKDKSKKKDKKDKKDKAEAKESETPAPAPVEPATPITDSELRSPLTDAGSSGARTPKGKPSRNPWTIFMRLGNVSSYPTEGEVREFFKEASAGITKVNVPSGPSSTRSKIAYVEFGDEEAMRAALQNHEEKLKDVVPDVVQATDRESRGETFGRGSMRGRGRGGFAARGLAAAGLSGRRGGFSSDKPNGDAA